MNFNRKALLSACFFVSGFCGLLYQLVWVRTAFASFGVITPVLSVVISVFMLGLSLGSWGGGKVIGGLIRKIGMSGIFFYGLSEFGVGLGAFLVPFLFAAGERFLLTVGEANSLWYLVLSGACISLAIFPWCVLMGTTFPFTMAYIRQIDTSYQKGFGFLYSANVLGALSGTLVTAFVLVETLGFRHTLQLGGTLNFLIAAACLTLGLKRVTYAGDPKVSVHLLKEGVSKAEIFVKVALFGTGFVSLGMEVVWTRALTPVMGTQVYSFALLLFVYLLATWLGSLTQSSLRPGSALRLSVPKTLALLAVAVCLPAVTNDPRMHPEGFLAFGPFLFRTRLFPYLASIFPFCFFLGYFTPRLIDDYAGGNPRVAGKLYAFNSAGCILGPLFAGYLLLPWAGVQLSLVLLAIPCLLFAAFSFHELRPRFRLATGGISISLMAICTFVSKGYEVPYGIKNMEVRRDHTATTVSFGEGRNRQMLVNGAAITVFGQITKYMAHLPLAFHQGPPRTVLVICFGMGTTYRSSLSWDVQTTAVELLPSVRDAFPFYFDDVPQVLQNPKGRIVIDDGRRFLKRNTEQYDVITVDPPPPAEAAGSSLLYSEEFYELIKTRLKADGILQQWYGTGEVATLQAAARSLTNNFPYVNLYRSVENWGFHFLASRVPIPELGPESFVTRLPPRARQDLMESSKGGDLTKEFAEILARQIPVDWILSADPKVRITDDQPFNEYFLIRRLTRAPKFL